MSFYVTPIRSIVVKGKRVNVKLNPTQKRQELFRDVFRIKTGHRSLIFKFKVEARVEYLQKAIGCFYGYTQRRDVYLKNVNFKKYSQGLGAEYPINNRNELFILMRDFARGNHYLKGDLTSCYNSIGLTKDMLSVLTNRKVQRSEYLYTKFTGLSQEDYLNSLRKYDITLRKYEKFDKNCKEELEKQHCERDMLVKQHSHSKNPHI